MRRYWVVAVAGLTLLGALAPPAFAQAPAPKVTISGLLDFATTWSNNLQDTDSTRRETEWYSRERGRLDFIGELGKAKMVWGIELDFVNGNTTTGGTHAGVSAGFDLDTDVAGVVETKWLYLDFPFTGAGALLPFIAVPTQARGGAQPFVGHDYKFGILASGDFGGLTLTTTLAPGVKNTLTVAQLDECNFDTEANGRCPGTNRENWAILDSIEFSPQKGLTVKPTFSYADFTGAHTGAGGFLGTINRGGFTIGALKQWRATVGGDVRWTMGPWSLEPTFHYQFGEQDISATREVDINAWIVDVIGGWRSGPLNLELRFMYTSGNDADECVQTTVTGCKGRSDINYYTPINTGFAYFTGWSELQTSGTEYNNCFPCGAQPLALGRAVGYDKYGRIVLSARATYAVTPAFSLLGMVIPSWTAEEVDTNGALSTTTGITPALKTGESRVNGDESYLGTEINVGFTWRFAPGLTFDWRYNHLFAGEAFDQCQVSGGCASNRQVRGAKDIDSVIARVRYTF
ncbi:MAG: porin [Candidatus Rokubacteria bacterium]|nr:porin [Candidatus Rokubacteria bacterium]